MCAFFYVFAVILFRRTYTHSRDRAPRIVYVYKWNVSIVNDEIIGLERVAPTIKIKEKEKHKKTI